ncbi:minichromosome maintenance protein MCM [Candidatus Micrarchaeota archaeon]|nr:minichromosome maintenance protein MCM [Candidatus Micrarchaeota archaeon]
MSPNRSCSSLRKTSRPSAFTSTASAEKDKAGEGWVLKAGALVLASGGLVAIDEFDKMQEEDRANIHEALEQQQISIAKAGIVTRFKAKTSVLAAANPKFGRFDPNTPIAEQFEIPVTLLSRFDLIFTIRDIIDEGQDRRMATHILSGLKFAGERKAGVKVEEAQTPSNLISTDLLRKYIAFARRSVFPQLTPDATERIKDFYVQLRALGAKTQTFPVTPRDLEGLVRLAEASAKMRLSTQVELQDAEYAIALKDFVLNLVFVDKATGKIDADVILTGTSKAKRDKIFTILNIVRELQREFDMVETHEVLKRATEHGVDEQDAVKIIDELKTKGELYSPKAGFVKTPSKEYG